MSLKKKLENIFKIKIEYLENRNAKNLKISNISLGSKIFLSYYFKGIRLIDNFQLITKNKHLHLKMKQTLSHR